MEYNFFICQLIKRKKLNHFNRFILMRLSVAIILSLLSPVYGAGQEYVYAQETKSKENFTEEKIKWRILSVDDDGQGALLIADSIIDCISYSDRESCWDICTLRDWLNNDFYNSAFDNNEKNAIKQTSVKTESYYSTGEKIVTQDNIYILSREEAFDSDYGFEKTEYRISKVTDYALCKNTNNDRGGYLYYSWWTRSPGYDCRASAIDRDGTFLTNQVCHPGFWGVRPVLHADLSSYAFEDAGEVDSLGNVSNFNDGYSNPRKNAKGEMRWDCVYFGKYPQTREFFNYPDDVFVGMHNSDSIPLNYYMQFYSYFKAKKLEKELNGNSGLCAGFDYASWLFSKGYINIQKDFNLRKVSALYENTSSTTLTIEGEPLTAYQLIKYCFIYQASPEHRWQQILHTKQSCYNYDSFVSNVKKTIDKHKACVIQWRKNGTNTCHVVLAYKYEECDRNCKFYVYDNNIGTNERPNIVFFRDNEESHYTSGSLSSIKLYGEDADTRDYSIAYMDDIDKLDKWLKSGGVTKDNAVSNTQTNNYNLVKINGSKANVICDGNKMNFNDAYNTTNGKITPILVAHGYNDSSDESIFAWSSSKKIDVYANNVTDFEIVSNKYEFDISIPAGASVKYEDLSESTNKSQYRFIIDNPTDENVILDYHDENDNTTRKIIESDSETELSGDETEIINEDTKKKTDEENDNSIDNKNKKNENTTEHLQNKTEQPTTQADNDNSSSDSKPTKINGVGTISADGTTLTDTDGKKYYISDKIKSTQVKKSTKIADKKSGGKYKITKIIKKKGKITGGTVTYMKPYNRNCKTANVKASIKLAGVTFKVNVIANNAFKGCKKLKKVTIKQNVKSIGKYAFAGCKKLSTVKCTSKVLTKIGSNAFSGDKKLTNITFKTTKLKTKTIGKNAFKGTSKKLTITVPKSTKKLYKKLFRKRGNKHITIK